jgi:ribulose-phosphate 3-epimerase
MSVIVPAILEQTREGFDDKNFIIERISGVERIHVDFADGKFVQSETVKASELEGLNPAFQYEAHLMVGEPTDFLDYQIAGFKTAIIHYEAFSSEEAIDQAAVAIKKLGMQPAVAINPNTPVSVLRYFGDTISNFLVMGVIPGAQGNPFVPETVSRVAELRALLPHVTIEVDGGINFSNAKEIMEAGADLLVVGSAIVKAASPQDAYAEIETTLLSNETKN